MTQRNASPNKGADTNNIPIMFSILLISNIALNKIVS